MCTILKICPNNRHIYRDLSGRTKNRRSWANYQKRKSGKKRNVAAES
jgi:hypothetical protein